MSGPPELLRPVVQILCFLNSIQGSPVFAASQHYPYCERTRKYFLQLLLPHLRLPATLLKNNLQNQVDKIQHWPTFLQWFLRHSVCPIQKLTYAMVVVWMLQLPSEDWIYFFL